MIPNFWITGIAVKKMAIFQYRFFFYFFRFLSKEVVRSCVSLRNRPLGEQFRAVNVTNGGHLLTTVPAARYRQWFRRRIRSTSSQSPPLSCRWSWRWLRALEIYGRACSGTWQIMHPASCLHAVCFLYRIPRRTLFEDFTMKSALKFCSYETQPYYRNAKPK